MYTAKSQFREFSIIRGILQVLSVTLVVWSPTERVE